MNLAVTHDGDLLLVRNIPMLVPRDSDLETLVSQVTDTLNREIEITWRKLFDAEPDADLHVYLIAESKIGRYLAAALEGDVNCRVTLVDPYAKIERASGVNATFPVCVAEGLAFNHCM